MPGLITVFNSTIYGEISTANCDVNFSASLDVEVYKAK